MAANTIPLNEAFTVPSGSRILYEYIELEQYVVNAVSFIRTGIELGQPTILIDTPEQHSRIRQAIRSGRSERDVAAEGRCIHFLERPEAGSLFELSEQMEAILAASPNARLWLHMDCSDPEALSGKQSIDRLKAAVTDAAAGDMVVCACDGTVLSAQAQTELLKKHAYFMTDEQLVPSHLYSGWHGPASFPSLADHLELRSEADLYKHMLDFVHEVSHEVRNPLTVIRAYAGILRERTSDESDKIRLSTICDYVDLIHHEISHLVRTEQLLSSGRSWERKLLSPRELLQEATPAIALKARTQDIRFECCIDLSGEELVLGNPQGFKLIVTNLAENAIKFSDPHREVRVEAAVRLSELVLIVSDEGAGMDDTDLRRLIDHIGQLHLEHGRGMTPYGIGLSMVKKLVDHFGGVIEVESSLGVGTTVTVRLPLTPGSRYRLQ